MEALLLGGRGEIRCPDQAVVEEIFLHDELRFQLALVRAPGRLDVEREPDRVLVRTEYPIDPFAGQRLDKAASIARIRVDTVRHEGTGAGRIVGPVAKG